MLFQVSPVLMTKTDSGVPSNDLKPVINPDVITRPFQKCGTASLFCSQFDDLRVNRFKSQQGSYGILYAHSP